MGGFTTATLENLEYAADGESCSVTLDGSTYKVYRKKKSGEVKEWFDKIGDLSPGEVSVALSDDGKYLNYVGEKRSFGGGKKGGGGPKWKKAQAEPAGAAQRLAPAAPKASADGMAFGNLMNVIAAVKRADPQATPEAAVQWVLQARKLLELGLVAASQTEDGGAPPESA